MILEKQELQNTYAGAKTGIFISIAAGIVFIIGLVDGYLRPLKCR